MTAGNVNLIDLIGSKAVISVAVGPSYVPCAFSTVDGAGITASATYANIK